MYYKEMLKCLKKLKVGKVKSGGRNNKGVITQRHIGGGSKRNLIMLDNKRESEDEEILVGKIVKDSNRTGGIVSVHRSNKESSFILLPEGLEEGKLIGGYKGQKIGVRKELKEYNKNDIVHDIELKRGEGGKVSRAAGTGAIKLFDYGKEVLLRMPSKELRLFDGECKGTFGKVSNRVWRFKKLLKAGDSRHKGKRPKVRGVAMNPVDHPHGGGEGKTSGGRPSVTKWSKVGKGKRTKKKLSWEILRTRDGFIDLRGVKLKRYL